MWTLARALAEVGDLVGEHPRRVHARFRKPLFLPGRFVIEARESGMEPIALLVKGAGLALLAWTLYRFILQDR
jgi:hypothetical protein